MPAARFALSVPAGLRDSARVRLFQLVAARSPLQRVRMVREECRSLVGYWGLVTVISYQVPAVSVINHQLPVISFQRSFEFLVTVHCSLVTGHCSQSKGPQSPLLPDSDAYKLAPATIDRQNTTFTYGGCVRQSVRKSKPP